MTNEQFIEAVVTKRVEKEVERVKKRILAEAEYLLELADKLDNADASEKLQEDYKIGLSMKACAIRCAARGMVEAMEEATHE